MFSNIGNYYSSNEDSLRFSRDSSNSVNRDSLRFSRDSNNSVNRDNLRFSSNSGSALSLKENLKEDGKNAESRMSH
jgi:hypothetical protein